LGIQEAVMVLKKVFAAVVCTTLLAWGGLSRADEYRPEQFLGLDLPQALLSPKRLGPAQAFAPVAVEARADRGDERARVAGTENARPVAVSRIHVARHQGEKRHGVTPTRLARSRGNPLDAQAMDTRIQVWPCRSGGICGWKR
jgi:hypothetical protein